MKKTFFKIMTFMLISSLILSLLCPLGAYAAKKKKKLSDDEITQMTSTVNVLTKKIYSASLFSPLDNQKLVDLKDKLDEALAASPSTPELALLYYKTGVLYKVREYKDDAADCFTTVVQSFPGTPYAARASAELKKLK